MGLHVLYDGCACHNTLEDKKGNDVVLQCPKKEIPAAKLFVCVCGNLKKEGGFGC